MGKSKFIETRFFYVYAFIILEILFLVRFSVVGYGVGSDGEGYYMYLPSVILDHDLNFTNQALKAPWLYSPNQFLTKGRIDESLSEQKRIAAEGYVNWWSIGTSIFLLPFFLIAHGIVLLLSNFGVSIRSDGYSSVHQFITLTGSIIYGVAGLYISEKIGLMFRFPKNAIRMAMLFVLFGTFLLQYASVEASMSHSISFFASSLFLYIFLFKVHGKKYLYQYLAWGLLGGLMVCVRQQNIILFIIPAILVFIRFLSGIFTKKELRCYSLSIVTFVLGISPLLVTNALMHGGPFANPQNQLVFGGEFEFKRELIGLLFLNPIVSIGIIGFAMINIDRKSPVNTSMFIAVIVMIVFNSFITVKGASFGLRRYDSIIPMVMLGIAYILEKLKRKRRYVYSALIFLTILNLMYFFVYNLLPQYREFDLTIFQTTRAFFILVFS